MKLGRLGSAMLVLLFLGGAAVALAAGALDGKTFTGEIGDKGKPANAKDDFVFKDGKFTSTLCSTFGYKESAYEASSHEGVTQFKAHCVANNGSTMDWNGKAAGDNLEGTVVNVEKGQTSESWFKGTLKK